MTPGDYICHCGPTSAPGNPLYDGVRCDEKGNTT